ncbi:DUF58 domain-containing protein [Vibrio sp. JC009]|uniref:DUF58 domain-containing protein n=1 Tax=Vibrio sp. JC009 TaxID=2912314 RepID=UPI0023B14DEE|nr:DUF58 domain-containing protein [Vibrio sp. JC009]WED23830.1 DUF58 domain-containing protein [Vibrio sp. JC009]
MQHELPKYSDGVTLNFNELLQYKAQTIRWLPPAKSLWSQINGQHQSKQIGRGMNFSEVRKYQPGDDIRSIDWRVTARTGKPHTKLFTEEREQPVIIYADISASMRFGSSLMLKSVQMAHMASLISWLAVEQKDRIGAVIDTGNRLVDIRPTSRNRGPLQLLHQIVKMHNDELQNAQPASNTMENGLNALRRLCPKGSEIIILSDFVRFHEDDAAILTQIRQHNRVQLVHFYDPLEMGKTKFKGTEKVTNGRNTQWLNFSAKSTRQQLENLFNSEQEKIKQVSRSLAIPYYSISSAKPLIYQIAGT